MKRNQEYYRNKYLIGIYYCDEDNDSLIALCNNLHEFADFLNITLNNAKTILFNFYTKKNKHLKYNGKLCEIYFLDKVILSDDNL